MKEDEVYDVCIIGGGPAGLATLSGVHSPYSLDGSTMTPSQQERALKELRKGSTKQKVCVVDTGSAWLETWQKNFDNLSIQYLRSPVLAHPDLFDPQNALLSYAVRNNRQDELLESGCLDVKSLSALGQSQIGLWKLPSTQLFVDFCLDLAADLPYTFVGNSKVLDIARDSITGFFQLTIQSGGPVPLATTTTVTAKAVVLAIGTVGRPILPPFLNKIPKWRLWNQPNVCSSSSATTFCRPADMNVPWKKKEFPVLVVGGGLTAVQVALKEVYRCNREYCHFHTSKSSAAPRVILVSKRPLVEKHFDIHVEWFDMRKTNKCMADFYHHPMEDRKRALFDARQGGSVPPMYLRQLQDAIKKGHLKCLVGEIECREEIDPDPSWNNPDARHVQVSTNDKNNAETIASFWVDRTVVACGVEPNSEGSPLIQNIQSKWPTRMEGGLPCVTQDLRWKEDMDLFVVGSLGALNIGPDAGNLMGIRRAAQLVANALGCRSWLRQTVFANPFEALQEWSDDDDDSLSSEEEETVYATATKSKKAFGECDSDTDGESVSDCSTCA